MSTLRLHVRRHSPDIKVKFYDCDYDYGLCGLLCRVTVVLLLCIRAQVHWSHASYAAHAHAVLYLLKTDA
jgi:hypothetical protein